MNNSMSILIKNKLNTACKIKQITRQKVTKALNSIPDNPNDKTVQKT